MRPPLRGQIYVWKGEPVKQRTLLAFSTFGLVLLLAAACGGDGSIPTATRPPTPSPTPIPLTGEPTIPPPPIACDDPANLELSSVGEEQKFDTEELSACEGAQVTLKFDNSSTSLEHNWVLVKNGTKDDVAARGQFFPTGDWIDPNDPDIIDKVHTKLLTAGEIEEKSFTAPTAGKYQFVCTFPGHNLTMFGDFLVTASGAAVAASPTTAPVDSPTPAPPPTPEPAGPISLEISSVGEEQKFDQETFAVREGAQVTLTYNNVSEALQHNWVLVKNGTKDDVAAAGQFFPTDNWIDPDDPNIIDEAHTKLTDPGKTGQIIFTAPAAGKYQFVCTFPGHNLTMFGEFIVSK